jgi:BirA family biotin operon repressor/biotin-[acetyl-CoA-carboxylase] ligase
LEIFYFDELDSTHLFLVDLLKQRRVKPPLAIVANSQSAGIGSGDNSWKSFEGNLFLSFALYCDELPRDLPQTSYSIYFAYLLKELLAKQGSKIWLKWPNDLFIDEKKVGGVITKLINNSVAICSIGLNIKKAPQNFNILDIDIDKSRLLELYFLKLKEDHLWKNIFSKYEIEFHKSREFSYFDREIKKRVSLKDAVLNKDGSISIENREVYSLR